MPLNPGGTIIRGLPAQPHPITKPSPRRARTPLEATSIATMFVAVGGILVTAASWLPHTTIVPSPFRAAQNLPAAIATTFVRPGGMLVSPLELEPHPTTVPFARKAKLYSIADATSITSFNPGG